MNDDAIRDRLKEVKQQIQSACVTEAFRTICDLASPDYDFSVQTRFAKIFQSLPTADLDLQPTNVALLGSSTLDHFADVLRWWLACEGFDATFYLAEHDTIHQTILNPASDLYAFKPDVVWIVSNQRDVHISVTPGDDSATIGAAVSAAVEEWAMLWSTIQQHVPCSILQNNAELPAQRVFGSYEGTAAWSRANTLRRFNLALAEKAGPGVILFDWDYLSSLHGKAHWFDERYWYHSKHAFHMDAYGDVAFEAARMIGALMGKAKKCLVLDLDNTLWGGVIGDDGLQGIRLGMGADGEAFVDFQHYLKALKQRGVILAVCSKNDEENAREPFTAHMDMVLTLDDIAVFKANWRPKSDNIREIAQTLNIGTDSMVFVDDNPAERAQVREFLPEVAVPELPDDPSLFLATLDGGRYFETVAFSAEDSKRADLYRENAQRAQYQEVCTDLSSYLQNLEMVAICGISDDYHLPRMAQLINKSNQFHLTTTRYTEAEILAMNTDPDYSCLYFKLRDKFGDNGLISVVIIHRSDTGTAMIDTWVMSCRVLARGMEEFICSKLVALCRDQGVRYLSGTYIPTKKNGLVSDLFARLGFDKSGEEGDTTMWTLNLSGDLPELVNYIVENSTGTEVNA